MPNKISKIIQWLGQQYILPTSGFRQIFLQLLLQIRSHAHRQLRHALRGHADGGGVD
jgi:hypothetical protein